MRHGFRSRSVRVLTFLFALLLIVPFCDASVAQENSRQAAGRFDFYVLALSWSPSFCAAQRERGSRHRNNNAQCGGRPFAFVVHGLWPQFDRGFPSYCEVPAPRLSRSIVDSMLDLMPSPGLIYHEWDRHGTCSGLPPAAYFATIRKAYAAVKIPAEYRLLDKPIAVTPAAVATAFVKANPGLTSADMAVGCDRKRLTEVRICLTTDFKFHACPQIVRRSCRREGILMPAVRGG